MKKWLSPHLTSGGVLAAKNTAEKAHIIKQYIRSIALLWPEAWGDVKEFNLCRPIGFEVILGVFAPAKARCDLNAGKQYTAETFAEQMAPLRTVAIELPAGGMLTLDWKRGTMGILSNSTMRTMITRRLADTLRRADEDDDVAYSS